MRGLTVGRVWGMPVVLSPALAGGLALGLLVAIEVHAVRGLVLVVAGAIASLLAHELAHGVAARAQGFDVDRVELSVVGGRAVWSAVDPDAHAALVIAAAGPAASAALAALFALAGNHSLAVMNLAGAVVNLLPFRGLDGGVIWQAATTSSAPAP